MISEEYLGKCILCNKEFKDDITHWATECEETLNLRKEWLAEMTEWMKVMHKENWKIPFINYLLKGINITGLEKRVIKNYENKATNFMKELYEIRKKTAAKLIAAKKKPLEEPICIVVETEPGLLIDPGIAAEIPDPVD